MLATVGTGTPKPPTKKANKNAKNDLTDTTPTQRDKGDFTTVTHKKHLSHNQQRAAKRKATLQKANTTIPGSTQAVESSACITPLFDDDYAGEEGDLDTIIFADDPLLASTKDTLEAFSSLLNEPANLRETNLKLANKDWGGAEDDILLSQLISLPARYAVKHGLPLTTTQTKIEMAKGLNPNNVTTYINTMENAWGGCLPLNFTVRELPQFTRFASAADKRPTHNVSSNFNLKNPAECQAFISLLVSAVVKLARDQIIPAPLSLDRLAHIIDHAGMNLTFNNLKQTIIDDVRANTGTTPGSW